MLFAFLQKNLVNVAMRMDEAFYNISMYLYNKNILKYAQIARSGPKSMILDIEGLSNKYGYFVLQHWSQKYTLCLKLVR